MPFTELVVPTLKTDPVTEATFTTEVAPFLITILDTHATPPKSKYFGKILLENGNDVSGDFRLCVGLEWEDASHFNTFVASENFRTFKSIVKPHSVAPPVPQLYNTDFGPSEVFRSALTEVWQVKIGEGDKKVVEVRGTWEKFVSAVTEAGGVNGNGDGIQGTSLNLEEKRWVGVLGWESSEMREKVLGSAAVKEARKSLDILVWNTSIPFVTAIERVSKDLQAPISNTPVLCLEIAPSLTVSLTEPLGILAVVRREEDGSNKPCIFHWSVSSDVWGPSGYILFQHTVNGLKKVGKHRLPPPETLELRQRDAEFEELLPGQCLKGNLRDISPFWDQLVAGEKYELLWPGAEYALWDWGTFREHVGQQIGTNLGLPRAVIPGGVCTTLTIIEEAEVFQRAPSPPPTRKSQRIPRTTCLTVSLEGPSKMIWEQRITVTMKNLPFSFLNFRLHRRNHDYDMSDSDDDSPEWEAVTDDELFLSLQPGESWTERIILDIDDLHPDTAIGDSHRLQYWGGRVKWWVWGRRQEHANTVVKAPPWTGSDVVDPDGNGGKPHIIIPESNRVESDIVQNTVDVTIESI
ncbi:hypothetical protein PENFLA_c012G05203 [Penicillium flavigenum]|uniref:Uncharacterized protein n=1 Tax=Penicillium flavigenum TaxID=254877 RepID=A0A1V6T9P0_9EURO|nr:hypothetical protein PENFLA_c012G05203 [Penicillium flavigenum]